MADGGLANHFANHFANDGMQGLWRYWAAACASGPRTLATNLDLPAGVLELEGSRWPLLLHRAARSGQPHAYTASLTTQYLRYTAAELHRLPSPRLRMLARGALKAAGALLAVARSDEVVQWNAWGLSTNPLSPAIAEAARPAADCLIEARPDAAVLVRNIDDVARPGCVAAFRAAGYLLVAARQVHHFDGAGAGYLRRDATRRDRRLLSRRDGYRTCEHDDFSASDMPRIARLYRMVYLERHSPLNVDYTDAFFLRAWRERWLEFVGFRNPDGEVDAVMGCLRTDGTVSTPFLGHDTTRPVELGLYRRLVALLLERTAERREHLNFSSGADEFKRRRGGEPVLEFNALHVAHLPRLRRQAWQALAAASDRYAAQVFAHASG
jgi:hypothetical protein